MRHIMSRLALAALVAAVVAVPLLVRTQPSLAEALSPAFSPQTAAQGAFGRVIDDQTAVLSRSRQRGDRTGELDALVQRAEAYQTLGYHLLAIEDLNNALTLAELVDDPRRLAAVYGSLGSAQLLAGAPYLAKPALERSLELARAHRLQGVEAVTQINLGNLFVSGDHLDAAVDAYKAGAELATEQSMPSLAIRALLNLARVMVRIGNFQAAETYAEEARARLDRLPDDQERARQLVALGVLYQDIGAATGNAGGTAARSNTALTEAEHIAVALGESGVEAVALGYLAHGHELASRLDEALPLTRRALALAQSTGSPENEYRWQWQIGRLLRKQGDVEGAIEAYRGALRALDSIRFDLAPLSTEGADIRFRQAYGPVFLEFADLLLRRAHQTVDHGTNQLLLQEARKTMERFKTAELENYFKDQCIVELQARVKPIEMLDERTAALYSIVFADRIVLLLGIRNELKQIELAVSRDVLETEVRQLRRRLELSELRVGTRYLESARTLYAQLIEPITKDLAENDVDTLVFIPDGPLRLIPLAALHDGHEFLVSRYAIATAPGLTLLDPRPITRTRIHPLLAGLTKEKPGFPALPYVDSELKTIHRMYGGDVLKDQSFVTRQLEDLLKARSYSVIHIASHAEFSPDPKDTFLLTFDGRLDMNRLEGLIKPSLFREEPVELISLSACRTAVGDERAALGLAGVAVKAGARSALATLWQVNDEAASLLVSEFYRQLDNPRISKARALQQAQLSLQKQKAFEHPYYWAQFLIIGNWL